MSKNEKRPGTGSIIAGDMVIAGEVHFSGQLLVDGKIEGTLLGDGVELGDAGQLRGEIHLRSLDCQGRVEGKLSAGRLRLRKTGEIVGEVVARELDMEAGAVLVGETTVKDDIDLDSPLGAQTQKFRENQRQVTSAAIPAAESAGPQLSEHEATIASLLGAIKGGSRFVMVVSQKQEIRQAFGTELKDRLAELFQLIVIDRPGGSTRDVLLRIAEDLDVTFGESDDNTKIRETLSTAICKTKRAGKPYLLFMENGENMFPATLEGLLRYLADVKPDSETTGLIILGSNELKKLKDRDGAETVMREPDCTFEL